MTDQELLDTYREEILGPSDVYGALTVERLIESHKRQREIIKEQNEAAQRSEAAVQNDVTKRVHAAYQARLENAIITLGEVKLTLTSIRLNGELEAPVEDLLDQRPTYKLGFSCRAENALYTAGVQTLRALTEKTPYELSRMRYVGLSTFREILEILAGFKLQLAERKPHESNLPRPYRKLLNPS